MSATTLPASPMVADPYATLIATVPNEEPRRRMANRLTDRDRNGIVRAAVMMGTFVGHDHPCRQLGIMAAPHRRERALIRHHRPPTAFRAGMDRRRWRCRLPRRETRRRGR